MDKYLIPLWTIYGIGVVLFPIGVGFFSSHTKDDDISHRILNESLSVLILGLLWPILIVLALLVGLMSLIVCVLGFIGFGLQCLGSLLAKKVF